MINIQVKVDVDKAVRAFGRLAETQLPFATARALTWTARDAQGDMRQRLPGVFTLRNNFVRGSIRFTAARKNNLSAEVGSLRQPHQGGGNTDFLELHETSGTKRPRGRHVAVPMSVRRTKRGIIKKAERPKALIGQPDIFKKTYKTGAQGILRRPKNRREKPTLLYLLLPSAPIEEAFGLEKTVQKTVQNRFDRNFYRSLAEAVHSKL